MTTGSETSNGGTSKTGSVRMELSDEVESSGAVMYLARTRLLGAPQSSEPYIH
jgi:hypothetical protein